jgi:hypothetical protein
VRHALIHKRAVLIDQGAQMRPLPKVCVYIASDNRYIVRVFARRMRSRGSADAANLATRGAFAGSKGSPVVTQWKLGKHPKEELKG